MEGSSDGWEKETHLAEVPGMEPNNRRILSNDSQQVNQHCANKPVHSPN
jgi:hypothetical protein